MFAPDRGHLYSPTYVDRPIACRAPGRPSAEQEVTTVEITMTSTQPKQLSMQSLDLRAAVVDRVLYTGAWSGDNCTAARTRVVAPQLLGDEGTRLSAAERMQPTLAQTISLPVNAAVFGGLVGIRSWSPPV